MKRRKELIIDELIADFFVEGNPKPVPKIITPGGKVRPKESGRQRNWKEFVVIMARQHTKRMIERHEAFVMEMVFVLKRPKTSKRKHPTTTPDDDNLGYLVTNALKGTCYVDDCHRIMHIIEERYAETDDPDDPTGLYVTIWTVE